MNIIEKAYLYYSYDSYHLVVTMQITNSFIESTVIFRKERMKLLTLSQTSPGFHMSAVQVF